jgi:hypothetical protein
MVNGQAYKLELAASMIMMRTMLPHTGDSIIGMR